MSDNNSEMANRLIAERKAVEKIYQAFSLHDPDLMDEAVTQDWKDIPLAPGQASGPEGLKPIIRGFIEAFPDVKITIHDLLQTRGRLPCAQKLPVPITATLWASNRPANLSASGCMNFMS